MTVRFQDISVGDAIPDLVKPVITRTQLALFAGASGDHNPIHLDDEQARNGGLPGVIAHGMLSMAFLGQVLTNWAPQKAVRSYSARFTAMAFPGDTITCKGVVKAKGEEAGEAYVDLDITALNQKGEQTLAGQARIALS
ncbi:MaoC family dehydratase [Magnetospirillum sp. SS-4]|uniref:MaoC family dehydratase n=1 Tax=Magnetospirillum sp. SS-4 TaxID=2681465 RepID=UPI0013827566|nr:MaoC family dehydratase [Magnetospirillum sp. SS-4]CAA7612284.1 MaoC-like dehydratase [Magnetospirillum sp. SS-4]